VQEEPFWQESSQFTRELALQREVEIDVETVRISIVFIHYCFHPLFDRIMMFVDVYCGDMHELNISVSLSSIASLVS